MNNLLSLSLCVFVFSLLVLSTSTNSYAQCEVTGMTADGGEIVVCDGVDLDGVETTDNQDEVTVLETADLFSLSEDGTITTFTGDDEVIMNGGKIDNNFNPSDPDQGGDGIYADEGDDTVTIRDGLITATEDCVGTQEDDDMVIVEGGRLECQDDALDLGSDDDMAIVTGGTLIGDEDGITCGSGDDKVIVSNALIITTDLSENNTGETSGNNAIEGNSGDDVITIGDNVRLQGNIDGNQGDDTLIFNMAVAPLRLDQICSEIEAKDPIAGGIVINGLVYTWRNFESLQCDLVPGEISPIPTLSQWGLIIMAGVLGLLGFITIHRRKAAV